MTKEGRGRDIETESSSQKGRRRDREKETKDHVYRQKNVGESAHKNRQSG